MQCHHELSACSVLVSFHLIHAINRFHKRCLYQKTCSLVFKKKSCHEMMNNVPNGILFLYFNLQLSFGFGFPSSTTSTTATTPSTSSASIPFLPNDCSYCPDCALVNREQIFGGNSANRHQVSGKFKMFKNRLLHFHW